MVGVYDTGEGVRGALNRGHDGRQELRQASRRCSEEPEGVASAVIMNHMMGTTPRRLPGVPAW